MSSSAPSGGSAPADPSRVRFLAFLLDDLSRGLLMAHVHELGVADADGWTTHADHVTFIHTPSAEQLASFPWGLECEMEVVGFAGDERCCAVQVDVPTWVPVHPQVAVPHVTVSCAPGARAVESDAMLMRKMALGEIVFTREFMPLTLKGRFGGVTMVDARVYAQPGVMDADTRTAVAAVVQADAAADAADAAAAAAEASRVESEKAEARTFSMRLAEEKLGEVKLSSRFAGLEQDGEDEDIEEEEESEEPESNESNDAAHGSPARRRGLKTTCETCGKRHRGRCWHEDDEIERRYDNPVCETCGKRHKDRCRLEKKASDEIERRYDNPVCETCGKRHKGRCWHEDGDAAISISGDDLGPNEGDKGKAPAHAPATEPGAFRDATALERAHDLEGGPTVFLDAGANEENDVDFTEAELLLRELGFADSGAPAKDDDARLRASSASGTTRAGAKRHADSQQKLVSLFPDVPTQVIDDALFECDGNVNAAAARFVSGNVPASVPAYGCGVDNLGRSVSRMDTHENQTTSSYPPGDPRFSFRNRRRAAWYPRSDAWLNPEPEAASSALGRIERDVGGLFEWERAGRHRDGAVSRDGYGDDHGDPTIGEQNGVARFYGRGADVPGPNAFSGRNSGKRAGGDASNSGAPARSANFATDRDGLPNASAVSRLPKLDMVRLKQTNVSKHEAMRRSNEHRQNADALFSARARFAGLAQQARARGDGRTAKDLFGRAKECDLQAHGHRAKALQLAHLHYNDGGGGGLNTIDLHGADVSAATDKVARVLSAVSELPMSALKVIYGQGKNSEMGRARLGPAVREFLEGQNIKFYEAQDGGSLIVPLS
jgi:hypothetical protein